MNNKKLNIEAKVTLLLRESDLKLLIRAMQSYISVTRHEAHDCSYLLDVLETIDMPG